MRFFSGARNSFWLDAILFKRAENSKGTGTFFHVPRTAGALGRFSLAHGRLADVLVLRSVSLKIFSKNDLPSKKSHNPSPNRDMSRKIFPFS
jgi:hypothetical protein